MLVGDLFWGIQGDRYAGLDAAALDVAQRLERLKGLACRCSHAEGKIVDRVRLIQ